MKDIISQREKRLQRLSGRLLHGGDYNPEQWLDRPDILEKDIEYMKKAGVNTVTLGVFSWSVYEPREGAYYFEWLDKIIDRLYENGIYVILATPSGARPVWMDLKYPEVMRVNEMGVRNTHGLRHNHCMSSPVYRQKVAQMDELLARRYGSHPAVILWHVSNELGGVCYCPLCVERFRSWLKRKYKTIDRLNQQWWTTFWSHRFSDFDQIDPPTPRGEGSIHGLNLDWKRFTTWNMNDYMKSEIKILREITPDIPITTNFMHVYKGLDYHEMAPELDIISWDSYPAWGNDKETLTDTFLHTAFEHAVMRSLKPDQPYLLMESVPSIVNWHPANRQKRPGMHRLTSMQAVACGSDSILYFQWRKSRGSFEQYHGAVIDHLGTDHTRVFREVAQLGQELKELSQIQGSVIRSDVAVLFDWNSRWAIEDMAGLSDRKNYDETVEEFYKNLLCHGIEPALISPEDEFDRYKVIIAPMLYILGEGVAGRLKKYVENGGLVLATYLTGYVNENTLCWLGGFPGDGLREVFGLYTEEIDSLYPKERNGLRFVENGNSSTCLDEDKKRVCMPENAIYEIRDFCEVLQTETARTVAVYTSDYYAQMPVITENTYGKGEAWYLGARCDEEGTARLLEMICTRAGLSWEQLPKGLEIHRRYHKDGRCAEFMLNTTQNPIIYKDKEIAPLDVELIMG